MPYTGKALSKARIKIGDTVPVPDPPTGETSWTYVASSISISGPGGEKDQVDHSDMDSDAREKFGGLTDNGTVTVSGNRSFGDAGQALVETLSAATGDQRAMAIEWYNPADDALIETATFVGEVLSFTPETALDAAVQIQFSITVSGAVIKTVEP